MIDEAAESDKRKAHCAGPESVTIPSGSAERSENLARISHEAAYPEVEFLPSSRNWWAWLKGTPAECIHLNGETSWMATLLPDTLYLQGKRTARREPVRPEVSLCRACLRDGGRGWWAVLRRDALSLHGKRAAGREPVRPEVSLCRACLADVARGEL